MPKWFLLFVVSAAILAAQPIPGRYIVEFQTEPAASVAAQGRLPLTAAVVAARRAQIQSEHAAVEPAIRALGGTVTRHYDTLLNAVAVSIDDRAASQLQQLPGVRQVYPDRKHRLNLDHLVTVHHITDAWQTLPNGMAGAGAGIFIAMLDTGIDINHPGFQGFTTPIPKGFPIVSSSAETANTNNKVIVSRDYTGDGGLDQVVGHGTGTAMVAAGLTNNPNIPGISPITGVASGAWLGNYRVLDDTGSGSTSWFLAALQDAVNDGMNVINYSAGGPDTDSGAETGPEARAVSAAVAAGVIVVIAAGNDGPAPGTLGDPGVVPSALTVGSNENNRFFYFAVTVGTAQPYLAQVPPSEEGNIAVASVSGPLTDVTTLDGNGFGCNSFAANSLSGQIALISRGGPNNTPCSFDTKLNNAQNAGAIGAVVYDNQAEADLVLMSITSVLPATFVSQASGQAILAQVAANPGITATIDFTGFVPFSTSSDVLSDFSSLGPTPGAGLKPELLATGDNVVTAYTTLNPLNSGPPYQLVDGTSLSTPAVSGSLALIMSARPGLTPAQYRSLVVNTTTGLVDSNGNVITPQATGSGKMNVLQALQTNLTAVPANVDFQTAPGTINGAQTITFTNVGGAADTFTIVVNPINTSGPAASVSTATFTLQPGASQAISVQLSGTGLSPGEYDGFLAITGTQTSVVTRVPYWFGVPGSAVANIGALFFEPYSDDAGDPYSPGDTTSILIRTTDLIGMPFDAGAPQATITGVRSSVTVSATGSIPGTYQVNVHVGRPDSNGLNVVTLTAPGGASVELSLFVQ